MFNRYVQLPEGMGNWESMSKNGSDVPKNGIFFGPMAPQDMPAGHVDSRVLPYGYKRVQGAAHAR